MMNVVGVILAAGASRRFAEQPPPSGHESLPRLKQLLPFGGESLVRRVSLSAAASKLSSVLVVIGFDAEAVRNEISDLPVEIVENPDWQAGQSTSVRAGLSSIDPGAEAAIFLPCDQPFLSAETIDRLIEARAERGTSILIAAFEGRQGAPVLISREFFEQMSTLQGDEGGRQMFWMHTDSLGMVELDSALPLEDIDTFDDYLALRSHL